MNVGSGRLCGNIVEVLTEQTACRSSGERAGRRNERYHQAMTSSMLVVAGKLTLRVPELKFPCPPDLYGTNIDHPSSFMPQVPWFTIEVLLHTSAIPKSNKLTLI